MRLNIRHHTQYKYAEPVSAAIQVLRLTPRNHDGQFIKNWRVEIDADCRLARDEDAYGNITHTFSIDGPLQEVNVLVEGAIETIDTSGAVAGAPERFPPGFWLRRSALTTPSAEIEAMARGVNAGEGGDQIATLHALMRAINSEMPFVIGDTTPATTAAQAYAKRSGVCQDHAQVFAAAARSLGIPARYVGGYYLRTDTTDQLAGHAWAEAWLPGIGWTGFDPANGVCVDDRYVRIAAGVDSLDASPIRGVRVGGSGETMTVSVNVAVAQMTGNQ
jgi:transglutaminase-like putative cysteine protease